jgi:hypothetical protein
MMADGLMVLSGQVCWEAILRPCTLPIYYPVQLNPSVGGSVVLTSTATSDVSESCSTHIYTQMMYDNKITLP